jgi:hypothetical protein
MSTLPAPSCIRRTEINQEIKASPGITYDNFSQSLDNLMSKVGEVAGPSWPKQMMDALYTTVRLSQWKPSLSVSEPAFELWNKEQSIRVMVTLKKVEVTTGLSMKEGRGIRRYRAADGLTASNLFASIKHAQELIRTVMNNADASLPDEEFFEPTSPAEAAEALDAVLNGEDDAQTAMIQAQTETISTAPVWRQESYESIPSKPGTEKAFVGVPEKADIKQCRPTMDREQLLKHLKSLQGRVLTIVDAALGDKAQREAVKTLVNKEFRREIDKTITFFELPGEGHSLGDEE